MPPPLLSVIIVCRNPGERVRKALASVWDQRDASPEVIVIDGASTDGTREWLESQRARIATFVSEPDRGVYDAMNKGVALARGEWVLFLGADDLLAGNDVLERAAASLVAAKPDVAVGEARYDNGRVYRFTSPDPAIRRNFIHHQAAFYRRSLLAGNGGFDQNLRVMADYDLNLRLHARGASLAPLGFRVAECASGGLSDSGAWLGYREEITVRHRHFPAWRCWLWDVASVLRCLRKKLVRLF